MKFDLYNKKVLLTGATGGIGSALSLILADKYHCTVYGVGRNEKKAFSLESEINNACANSKFAKKLLKKGQDLTMRIGKFVPIIADVTTDEGREKLNGLDVDILINNAGIMPPFVKTENTDVDTFEKVLSCNFYAPLLLIKQFLPVLKSKKQGGIINISSSDALCAVAGTSAYCVSKSAIKSLSECLGAEENLFVATVYPGFTKTGLFGNIDYNDKLLKLICSPAPTAAKRILRRVSRGKRHVIVGKDARLMNFGYRVAPNLTMKTIYKTLAKTDLEMFDGLKQ